MRYENEYYRWIVSRGVGANDRVASSPDSYLLYLRTIERILDIEIAPGTLGSDTDMLAIVSRLKGKRAGKTIQNYRSAMSQYVAMVAARGLVGFS